jgi:hypothetical protein
MTIEDRGPDGTTGPTPDPDAGAAPPNSDDAAAPPAKPPFDARSAAPVPTLEPPPAAAWPPPPKKRRPMARILLVVGIGAAVLGAIGARLLIGYLAANVAGAAFAGVFGGPWDRLPNDVKSGYEQRLEAAIGNRLDGLSDAAVADQVRRWVSAGFLRLDDTRLVRRLELEIAALGRAERGVCAAFGRQSATGQVIDPEVATKLLGSLEQADLIELFGIHLDAMEAELRGSPDPVRVTDSETTPVVNILVGGLDQSELNTLAAISAGQPVTDEDICSAIRSLYENALLLDPASMVIMARLDIQPQ